MDIHGVVLGFHAFFDRYNKGIGRCLPWLQGSVGNYIRIINDARTFDENRIQSGQRCGLVPQVTDHTYKICPFFTDIFYTPGEYLSIRIIVNERVTEKFDLWCRKLIFIHANNHCTSRPIWVVRVKLESVSS